MIVEVLLPISMFLLMAGMGLTLEVDDFRRIAGAPLATILGTVLQLVVVPAAGFAIAVAYDLPPLLAAGVVICAACPGGMFSNVFVHLAGANTALSVTLTASSTMVTLFTLPLWIRGILAWTGGGETIAEVPVLETAANLAGLTVLPIVVGMAARARWPDTAGYEKWLTRIGALGIGVALTIDWITREAAPMAELRQSFPPIIVLIAAMLVIGLGIPFLFRLSARDTVTLGVEVVVKNTLLGIVVARSALDFEAILPVMAYGTIETPLGGLLLVIWRWYEARHKG